MENSQPYEIPEETTKRLSAEAVPLRIVETAIGRAIERLQGGSENAVDLALVHLHHALDVIEASRS